MLKKVWIILFVLLLANELVYCQSFEVQQLTLDWAKLATLKQILQDMKQGYEIIEKGYSTIRDISQGSFNLHNTFLTSLLSVSPVVKQYKRVADIVSIQLNIVSEYKSAYKRFKQDTHFSPEELELMGSFYSGIFNKSVADLNAMITVVTDGEIRAGDDERLRQIDGIYSDIKKVLVSLQSFNNGTELLSLQRSQNQLDFELVKKLYGINK